ncbi:MAG: ribosome assembly cofactor RimP [Candidatus Cloacimonetes bacterium]|nr:ribosome assembly cofactor RimP [Candidatus Cloacimonadota bacterium]
MELKERIEQIAKKACLDVNVALYDLSLKSASKGLIVLIYITKIGGVNITECKRVSRNISEILETEDVIKERFFLEVSSPGLERALNQKKHYVSAIDEKVQISFTDDENTVTEIGILKEVLPESIKIEFEEAVKEIQLTDVKKAKTYFDYKKNK